MLTDTFASVLTGGKSSGCEKGVGVAVEVGVGVGVAVAVAVTVAVAVAVGVNVGVGVTVGVVVGVDVGVAVPVAVAVGVDVGVAVAVGVAVGFGPVYSMVSTGELALSRVSKRLAVALVDSSPRTSHPKLIDGSFSHNWASATICAELHV
jgi:hypothetical protein